MKFMHPEFLWALFALLIPLIIHLFSFRKFRTVYFSNVRFLKEVKEENASRSKLKHLLVLLARLLAIFFLVLAFARPYLPGEENEGSRQDSAVSIYVDNSFSMEANGEGVSLLDEAKGAALQILDAYGEDDRFQLLSNDFEGRHQRLLTKEEFRNELQEVEISPRVKTLKQVLARQRDALRDFDDPVYFMISDFQKKITNLPEDSGLALYLLPMKAVRQQNIAIDSAWLLAPVNLKGQTATLFVRIRNYGEDRVESDHVSVSVNGSRKALSDFEMEAGASITDTLTFTVPESGWNSGVIEISDYPVTFDDKYYFTFYAPSRIRILSLNREEEDPYINGLAVASFTEVVNKAIGQVDYSEFDRYNLIILNRLEGMSSGLAAELRNYIENGGKVLFFPSGNMDPGPVNDFLGSVGADPYGPLREEATRVRQINTGSGLYANVFEEIPRNMQYPEVKKYFRILRPAYSKGEELLILKNNDPLLLRYSFGNGSLFLSAVAPDLEFSNFPRHSLFAVTLFQIAISGRATEDLAFVIGRPGVLTVPRPAGPAGESLKLKSISEEGIDLFPRQRLLGRRLLLNFDSELGIDRAGIYGLYEPGNDTLLRLLAFNYDRSESDISSYSPEELASLYPQQVRSVLEAGGSQLALRITEINRGRSLWQASLLLVLLFLFIETLLLRFMPE